MRWNFIICLLLVTAVLAKPRSKRTLGKIKSLLVDKLFGSHQVVIAQPLMNYDYQRFKIPGFDDIVFKLSRKDKPEPRKDEAKPVKLEDPVIVRPEVAIIGSYLGTTTQKETRLAIEMVKSLINSGILIGRRDSSIQELGVPFIPQPPRLEYFEDQSMPLNVYEEGHMLVPMGMQQIVTPVQVQTGKQKGSGEDMTYKSFYGKEPPLPEYIKMRIAEVASIGANPYVVRQPLSMNGAPIPYYVNPGQIPEYVQEPIPYLSHGIPQPLINTAKHVGSNVYGDPIMVDRNPIFRSVPMPVAGNLIRTDGPYFVANKEKSTVKIRPYKYIKIKARKGQNIVSNFDKSIQETAVNEAYANEGESNANAYKIAVNEFLKNHSVDGLLVSQYAYKQINGNSRENYTEVKIEDAPSTEVAGSNTDYLKDYVFIPPYVIESPMLSALSLNNIPGDGNVGEQVDKNALISKISSNDVNRNQHVPSLKSNPVVVAEHNAENSDEHSIEENFKRNEAIESNKDYMNENSKRGDIPEATY